MHSDKTIQIIDSFKAKLYRYSLNIVGEPMDAEDVMQELLIRVWKQKDKFIELDNQEAWCMTVTRNLSIDKLRLRKNASGDIADYHFISDSTPTADKQLASNDIYDKVLKMLEVLPSYQKELVQLRDIEGYSYKEIAQLTGTNEDQVKINLFRARQKLKERLKNLKTV
jgi:RNA polymerase sigma factor (sigma-70 family)